MSLAILSLLGTLLGLGAWLWKRRVEETDTPEAKHEKRDQEDNAAVAAGAGGVDELNRRLAAYDSSLPDAGAPSDPG